MIIIIPTGYINPGVYVVKGLIKMNEFEFTPIFQADLPQTLTKSLSKSFSGFNRVVTSG